MVNIISILVMLLPVFLWLGYESNWMRVKLMIGAPSNRKSWLELKPWDYNNKRYPFWLKFPKLMEPLCGIEWLENTMHIIPEYKVILLTEHSTQTMRTQSASVLRDAFRVYRNPWLKVKLQACA